MISGLLILSFIFGITRVMALLNNEFQDITDQAQGFDSYQSTIYAGVLDTFLLQVTSSTVRLVLLDPTFSSTVATWIAPQDTIVTFARVVGVSKLCVCTAKRNRLVILTVQHNTETLPLLQQTLSIDLPSEVSCMETFSRSLLTSVVERNLQQQEQQEQFLVLGTYRSTLEIYSLLNGSLVRSFNLCERFGCEEGSVVHSVRVTQSFGKLFFLIGLRDGSLLWCDASNVSWDLNVLSKTMVGLHPVQIESLSPSDFLCISDKLWKVTTQQKQQQQQPTLNCRCIAFPSLVTHAIPIAFPSFQGLLVASEDSLHIVSFDPQQQQQKICINTVPLLSEYSVVLRPRKLVFHERSKTLVLLCSGATGDEVRIVKPDTGQTLALYSLEEGEIGTCLELWLWQLDAPTSEEHRHCICVGTTNGGVLVLRFPFLQLPVPQPPQPEPLVRLTQCSTSAPITCLHSFQHFLLASYYSCFSIFSLQKNGEEGPVQLIRVLENNLNSYISTLDSYKNLFVVGCKLKGYYIFNYNPLTSSIDLLLR
jgi:hypothetical protein